MSLNKTSKFIFYKLKITANRSKRAYNDCIIKYDALVTTKTGQTPLQEVKCSKVKMRMNNVFFYIFPLHQTNGK